MRIDSHQHFWEVDRFPYTWMPDDPASPLRRNYLPQDLGPILKQNRFDGSVVVQAAQVPGEVDWLLELASAHDFILGVVGWLDLTDARLGDTLDRLQRHPKFVGVRHLIHDEADVRWMLRDDVVRGLQELEARDLPFDLLLRPQHLPFVPELCERAPRLRMVIDHIAKPLIAAQVTEPWATDLEAVAKIPAIFVKISGMITEADWAAWTPDHLRPYVQHVLGVFPPERLMFGSDWPVCRLAGSYKQVLSAFTQACGPLEKDRRARIMGETAAGFYRLAPPDHSISGSQSI